MSATEQRTLARAYCASDVSQLMQNPETPLVLQQAIVDFFTGSNDDPLPGFAGDPYTEEYTPERIEAALVAYEQIIEADIYRDSTPPGDPEEFPASISEHYEEFFVQREEYLDHALTQGLAYIEGRERDLHHADETQRLFLCVCLACAVAIVVCLLYLRFFS